nr:MAG: RNA-dependent RNA polymerase [Crogonang virus 152]
MEPYPGLLSYEDEMASKVGPLSVQQPLTSRLPAVEEYYTVRDSVPVDSRAISAVAKEWSGISGLRLRSSQRTIQEMQLATNSGNPWFTKRRRITDSILASTMRHVDEEKWQLFTPQGVYQLAAILGWRGQEGGPLPDDVKQRVIWMMSAVLNLQELRFYQPFITGVQKRNYIPAYVSMASVDQAITRLFDSKEPNQLVICTDFSKFDQHFNKDMADASLQVFDRFAVPDATYQWWREEVFPAKYRIPIICSPKLMATGFRWSMGSGSGGTNADESVSHRCLQHEAAISVGSTLNPNSQCLGDDGMVSFPNVTLTSVIDSYTRHGQVMNPDKQMVSRTECVYLRRWHSVNYRTDDGTMVGVYSTCRALGRLMYQERFYDSKIWGPKAVTLRAWSIIENCNAHPLFEDFVDYVIKGDKYRLGLDLPGFLDTVDATAQELTAVMPDFLGYVKGTLQRSNSVKSWRIYRYLRSKQLRP